MSMFSGLVDTVFGEGVSDNVISSINNYTGINLDFGLSSAASPTTPTTPTESTSFLTPTNILGGLSVYSQIAGRGDALKAKQAEATATADMNIALADKKFAQEKELLALKASLAGGGGGGGGGSAMAVQNAALAYDAKKTKYLGVQDARKQQQEAQGQSSAGIIQAIKNLTDAAQRPLIK